ncbi:PLP-dependent aminotransferase family protein [Paraburkholderia bryophila]|uniref:aminotransferase-like domain-containing protein n=1 Tax=Paraburkholderia bryophila TaxID=420952 RepID=UPI002349FE33|nr:PLP-dependent aminotransferase family protein [Paraburkholderia bryophila]WCM23163.1 PLP-dependent aminotransferase family protein [Paraburkholderia bryophila]
MSTRSRASLSYGVFNYTAGKESINFAYGLPDPVTFARLKWPVPMTVETGVSISDLPQYTDAYGLPELREQLGHRYGMMRNNVILTNGASQALQLLADAFIDPGDVVLTEDPSYLGALRIFSIAGATVVHVGMSRAGIDLDQLERALLQANGRAKVYYTTPAFHNPTGRHFERSHMAEVDALLSRYGVRLVQDLVYSELPYDGTFPEILQAGGNVINVHSFSKISGPGLRVGWVLAEPEIINRLAHLKCDGGVSPIVSNMALALLQSSSLDAHVDYLRSHYRSKRDAMHGLLQACRFCIPNYEVPSGGFSLWVSLAEGIDSAELVGEVCRRHNVKLVEGDRHGPSGVARVRLCFSYLQPNLIERGLAQIDDAHASLLATKRVKRHGLKTA